MCQPLEFLLQNAGSTSAYFFWLLTSKSFSHGGFERTVLNLRKRQLYRRALRSDVALQHAIEHAVGMTSEDRAVRDEAGRSDRDLDELAREFEHQIERLERAAQQVTIELGILERTSYNPALISFFDTSGPDTRSRPE